MTKKTKRQSETKADVRGVDLAEVERLLAFMEARGLGEFEYRRGDLHVRLRKESSAPAAGWAPVALPPAAQPAAQAPAAGRAAVAAHAAPGAAEAEADAGLHVIKSPIVGTFYSASSPEVAPFVSPGARVKSGDTLCIVEAMKLMNEIESDVAGEVVKVFVKNGDPVEYGQPLFGLRTGGAK
jgi:acetyl-CoA carboxylase biotin carboxyl carrier protein